MIIAGPAFTALVGKILLSAVSTNPPSRDSETTLGLLKSLRAGPEVERVSSTQKHPPCRSLVANLRFWLIRVLSLLMTSRTALRHPRPMQGKRRRLG